jgi:dCMP deaminase
MKMRTLAQKMLEQAEMVAQLSPDPSRKTGCAIVMNQFHDGTERAVVTGVNEFPRGVTPRLERPAKYVFMEHAERNAIYNAARRGIVLYGATIYLTWFPCADCARAIVCAGIKKLVGYEPDWTEERYGFKDARTILEEGGVEIVFEERT